MTAWFNNDEGWTVVVVGPPLSRRMSVHTHDRRGPALRAGHRKARWLVKEMRRAEHSR